jgi:hypothetical protein
LLPKVLKCGDGAKFKGYFVAYTEPFCVEYCNFVQGVSFAIGPKVFLITFKVNDVI